ncbi:MAG TPA: MOSC domain-containing protein [Thermodesulfovibrionales bacterium]|nr:MOSC domain-containing protein [Thermodesulfovibrionales bacterium]
MNQTAIESLNIGLPKKEVFHGREIVTGICKVPVSGPIVLGELGFEGDGVGDLKHHGGPDKAVCVYSADHYPYWENVFGTRLPSAPFGENLPVSGLREDEVRIGDVFKLGTAVVQVSQPRQPCGTLAIRYGRADIIPLVLDSGRTGFYLRVLEEGVVERSSPFALKERASQGITIAFANRIRHHDRENREAIEAVLEVRALSASWRCVFEDLLKKLSVSGSS